MHCQTANAVLFLLINITGSTYNFLLKSFIKLRIKILKIGDIKKKRGKKSKFQEIINKLTVFLLINKNLYNT